MKKFAFVIPLIAISLLSSCGGVKIPKLPSDLDLYKKKYDYNPETGDVRQICECEYNDKNLLTKTTTFVSFLQDTKYYDEMTYDENNNIKTKDVYTIIGDKEVARTKHVYENQYDSKKRLTQVVHKYCDNTEGWLISEKETYEYKTNSRIEEHYSYDSTDQEYYLDGKAIYKYDKNGCLINEKEYIYGSVAARENVITVNKYGCATLIELYYLLEDDKRGEKIGEININYLDNLWYRPLKLVQARINSSGVKRITEYEYNDKKQVISEKYYDEGDSSYIYYYTYEY